MISRDEVFEMVAKERDRQDAKWGFPQHNSPFEWVSIVTEELGELAKETNDAYIGKNPKKKRFWNYARSYSYGRCSNGNR